MCYLIAKKYRDKGCLAVQTEPTAPKREDFRSALKALREEADDVPEMSLEEINAEISATRAERKMG